jgi:D-glycerate 3-kinase
MDWTNHQLDAFSGAIYRFVQEETRLPADRHPALVELAGDLRARIDPDRRGCIGLAGAPGCGKSTLAQALACGLNAIEVPALVLSLDDYYQPRAYREQLAATHHPLFRQRGVPGSHELDRLMEDLDLLREGHARGRSVPVFDKSVDDRLPPDLWPEIEMDPVVTILEGWCVGAPPPGKREWTAAVGASNLPADDLGRWRGRVRYAWTDYHLALAGRLDELWYIRVPDWHSVIDWRWQQERDRDRRHLADREAVRAFLATFEPVVEIMQRTHPDWADLSLYADRAHHIHLANDHEARH